MVFCHGCGYYSCPHDVCACDDYDCYECVEAEVKTKPEVMGALARWDETVAAVKEAEQKRDNAAAALKFVIGNTTHAYVHGKKVTLAYPIPVEHIPAFIEWLRSL